MKKHHKIAVVILIATLALFFFQGHTVLAQENLKKLDDKGGYMIADLVIMRPLGIAATAVGAAAYVLSLPFSLAGGNEAEARQKLMGDPAGYTFTRPLGDF
ncbi:MAG: hypothetical protein J7M20_11050 [Deltaproteobacteria bacterium]|nr:hypothetical protein [Deltaproteobacteria bacterium]